MNKTKEENKKKPDRRVERTRRLLHNALMELIVEKGYEAITVQNIIDRANVGRSTFYSHFLDKQQLLLYGFKHLRAFLAEQQRKNDSEKANDNDERMLKFSLAMFRHAESHYKLYRAMVGKKSGAFVIRHIQLMIADLVRDEFAASKPHPASRIPIEVIVQYTANSFMALMTWWADKKMPCSAQDIDQMFHTLTMPGVKLALGPGSTKHGQKGKRE